MEFNRILALRKDLLNRLIANQYGTVARFPPQRASTGWEDLPPELNLSNQDIIFIKNAVSSCKYSGSCLFDMTEQRALANIETLAGMHVRLRDRGYIYTSEIPNVDDEGEWDDLGAECGLTHPERILLKNVVAKLTLEHTHLSQGLSCPIIEPIRDKLSSKEYTLVGWSLPLRRNWSDWKLIQINCGLSDEELSLTKNYMSFITDPNSCMFQPGPTIHWGELPEPIEPAIVAKLTDAGYGAVTALPNTTTPDASDEWATIKSKAKLSNAEAKAVRRALKAMSEKSPTHVAENFRRAGEPSTLQNMKESTRSMIAARFVVDPEFDLLNEFNAHLRYCRKNRRRVYAPVLAVLQSSGCGKSKLLIEACARFAEAEGRWNLKVPVSRYLCFRSFTSSATPTRTETLSRFVEEKTSTIWDWVLFFLSLLGTTSKVRAASSSSSSSSSSSAGVAADHPFMLSYDEQFALNVISTVGELRKELANQVAVSVGQDEEMMRASAAVETTAYQTIEEAYAKAITTTKLYTQLEEVVAKGVALVVLDEVAMSLIRTGGDTGPKSASFLNMRRGARVITRHIPLLVVLLDTNSKVSNMVPIAEEQGSNRAKICSTLLAPFYTLPVPLRGITYPQPVRDFRLKVKWALTPMDGATVDYVVRYNPVQMCVLSRPMFAAPFLAAKSSSDVESLLSDLARVAELKIVRCRESPPRALTTTDCLALAAARIFLKTTVFVDREQLLAGHLAYLAGVASGATQRIEVGYLSEPWVMDAALNVMNREGNALAVLRYMKDSLLAGTLGTIGGRGEVGELIACYILLRGYDTAVADLSRHETETLSFPPRALTVSLPTSVEVPSTKPIPLLLFLSKVCVADSVKQLLAKATEISKSGAADILQRGVVRFNHTRKLKAPITDTSALRAYFEVSAMLLCAFGEYAIDVVIPVAYPAQGNEMDLEDPNTYLMTALVVQIKMFNSATANPSVLLQKMRTHSLSTKLGESCLYMLMSVGRKKLPGAERMLEDSSGGNRPARDSTVQQRVLPLFCVLWNELVSDSAEEVGESADESPPPASPIAALSTGEVAVLREMQTFREVWELFAAQQVATGEEEEGKRGRETGGKGVGRGRGRKMRLRSGGRGATQVYSC